MILIIATVTTMDKMSPNCLLCVMSVYIWMYLSTPHCTHSNAFQFSIVHNAEHTFSSVSVSLRVLTHQLTSVRWIRNKLISSYRRYVTATPNQTHSRVVNLCLSYVLRNENGHRTVAWILWLTMDVSNTTYGCTAHVKMNKFEWDSFIFIT